MKKTTSQKIQEQKEIAAINNNAEGAVGLSPLVGVSRDDLADAAKLTGRQLIRQPLVTAKHGFNLLAKWVDVAYGRSQYHAGTHDKRFADDSWSETYFYKKLLQAYLAIDDVGKEWINDLDIEGVDREKVRFILKVLNDSVAPSNYLLTNPSALRKAKATRGRSLVHGAQNFIHDMRHNRQMPSQVDKSYFKIGENLATTPGAVVFRNEILELIQYQPSTPKVYERPVLVIPPQINKFYVFDLSPEKSIFQFMLAQGQQVFTVSWKNPDSSCSGWGLDEYVAALLDAVQAIQTITGQPSINLIGACSGGLTASVLTGYLHAIGSTAVHSLSLLVTVLSQTRNDSDITLFGDPVAIENARRNSRRKGVLEGAELSRIFSWMRPNDLIWNYVVNNYLMGNKPPVFDILYWNNDSTNLPAKLHSDFLDQFLSNPLAIPGDLSVLDTPIDLSSLTCDSYIMGGVNDHITPWHACYRSTQLLGGNIRFVLSNSGHIQALVNPPGNPKASYVTNSDLPEGHQDWLAGGASHQGSWWSDWFDWVQTRAGSQISAPTELGDGKDYCVKDAAPGSYVL